METTKNRTAAGEWHGRPARERQAPQHTGRMPVPLQTRGAMLLAFLSALVTCGCTLLPKAEADPTKFFVLSTSPAVAPRPPDGAPTVVLRSIELASYLKSRPILVRRGGNEIEFREFARWGEPLELGVARLLREELLASGTVGAVVNHGSRAAPAGELVELQVRVLACEGAADGNVLFRAVWEITKVSEKREAGLRGDYRASDLRWDGKNEAELAAKLSEAIAGLAAEIATALKR